MLNFEFSLQTLLQFYTSSTFIGFILSLGVLSLISVIFHLYPKSSFSIIGDLFFENIVTFYEDILGEKMSKNIKIYIVTLFFVIFLMNILSVMIDFFAPIFGMSTSGDFLIGSYITIPTSDMQFNIALSFFSTLLLIYIQFRSLGLRKFVYNYFPVWGKGYITIDSKIQSNFFAYPIYVFAKMGDIIISFFLSFLDIIGLLAKIISLGFRLFGNMTSGTVLLGMLVLGTSSFTESVTQFMGGINFPVIAPIIVYLQSLLVACIQAFVFPLLVAIFINMAQIEDESSLQVGT